MACTKRTYATKHGAKRALRQAKAAAARGVDRRCECRTYLCRDCGGYHLTSQPHPVFGNTSTDSLEQDSLRQSHDEATDEPEFVASDEAREAAKAGDWGPALDEYFDQRIGGAA